MTGDRHAVPQLVLVTGAPGSGKTSTARELARLLGVALLDQDVMTNPLVDVVGGLVGATAYDDSRLAGLVRDARYAALLGVAFDCLRAGSGAVLVAPFTSERRDAEAWARLADVATQAGGIARLVWLRIAADDLGARLRTRAEPRDAAKLADLPAYFAGLDLAPPVSPHIDVDALLPSVVQARAIRDALAPGSAPHP